MSIIVKDKVQRWGENETGDAYMIEERDSHDIFEKVPRFILNPSSHYKKHRPYADFEHFSGDIKPWLPFRVRERQGDIESMNDAKDTKQLWYHMIGKANKDYGLGIDIDAMVNIGEPTVRSLFVSSSFF